MKIKAVLISILFLFSINKSISQSIDLNGLKGTWKLPCTESFNDPGELICMNSDTKTTFNYNANTGKGEILSPDFGVINKYEIFVEGEQTMIKYYFNEEMEIGEIITLDKNGLKIKFEAAKYFLFFEKIK